MCLLASPGYFLGADGAAVKCPENGKCDGQDAMPRPEEGFWVDRSKIKFAGNLYACPRRTCTGGKTGTEKGIDSSQRRQRRLLGLSLTASNVSCWSVLAYNKSISAAIVCEDILCQVSLLRSVTSQSKNSYKTFAIYDQDGAYGPLCGSCKV